MANHRALAAAAAAAIGLVSTAYFFRRHFFFIKSRPSRVATRDALNALCKDLGKERGLEISLLDETSEAYEAENRVITRAFCEYAMFQWWFKASSFNPEQSTTFVSTLGRLVRLISSESCGFVLTAKKNGKIVASARVALRERGENPLGMDLAVFRGFFNGEIGFPWVLLSQLRDGKLMNRINNSMEMLDEARFITISRFPRAQYLHLLQLGSDPEHQSIGAGSALLAALCRIADEFHYQVYLETDTERLREFYQRNGFQVAINYVIPDPVDPFPINYGMIH